MTRDELIDTLGNVLVGAPDDRANAALSEAIALLRPTPTRDEILPANEVAFIRLARRATLRPRDIADLCDSHEALRARLALQGEPERGKTWQPIATAPRDATRVLVFCPSRHPPTREVFEAWWAIPYESAPLERGWWAYDGDKTMLSHDVHGIGATHWRPLPDPPPPPPQR